MTSTWRNAASAVKERRGNHPGDFPFSAVAAFDTYYAADLVFHDFFLFAARDEQGDEFAEKRKMADDHDVAAGLFKRFSRRGNLIVWAKTFAL